MTDSDLASRHFMSIVEAKELETKQGFIVKLEMFIDDYTVEKLEKSGQLINPELLSFLAWVKEK